MPAPQERLILLCKSSIIKSVQRGFPRSKKPDSIEEISLDRNTVFGNKVNPYDIDLMRGIIIHVRTGENIKASQNVLISMLEKLLSRTDVEEKKRILTEEYGMIMTTELEGRMRTMCNWSEAILEKGLEEGIEKGIEEGIEKGMKKGIGKERLNAIERMLQAGATKEQIISYGYSEEEFAKVEKMLLTLSGQGSTRPES